MQKNNEQQLPIILTGPASAIEYFKEIDQFIAATLGKEAQSLYDIVIDDAVKVAQLMKVALENVLAHRKTTGDAFHFNWSLLIEEDFQHPFEPTHENMANLTISHDLPTAELAANLRRAFSGIVAGNVKSGGVKAIREFGPFKISGDKRIMALMDKLLASFVSQQRMKLPGSEYVPFYKVVEG
jgi:hypothetical protein